MANGNENPKPQPLDLNALYLNGLDEGKRAAWEAAAKEETQTKQDRAAAATRKQAAAEASVRDASAARTAPPGPMIRGTPTLRSTPPAGVIAALPAEEMQMPPSFSFGGMTPTDPQAPPWAPTAPMTPAPESMFRPPRDPEMVRRIRDASILRDRFPFPAGMSDEEQNEVLRLGLKEQAFQKRSRELDAWALSGLRRAGSAIAYGPESGSLRATPRSPPPSTSLGAWWQQRQAPKLNQNESSE